MAVAKQRDDETGERRGSVVRTIHMLRALAEHTGAISNKQMADRLGLAPSTTHRLLDVLIQEGLVERDAVRGSYRAGRELYRLSALVMSKFDLAAYAGPVMERLGAKTGETVVLTVYNPTDHTAFFALAMNSLNSLGYRLELNRPISSIWGATGKAIVAFLPDDQAAAALASATPSPTSNTPPPPYAEFKKELQLIRERGYAQSKGEKVAGAASLAVPICNSKGIPFGSLALTIPQFRFSESLADVLVPALKVEARELSSIIEHLGR